MTTLQTLLNGIPLANDGDVIAAEHHNSLRTSVGLIASALPKIAGGQTAPGVGWQAYASGAGVYIDVDTSAAGFTTTPTYVTSLGGTALHWNTTGGSSVYSPTPTMFRIYVRWADGAALNPPIANQWGWHVLWIGIQ
jgi:hypothetical protein